METTIKGLATILIPITLVKVSKGSRGIRKLPKAKAKEKEKSRTRASNPIILNYSLKEE